MKKKIPHGELIENNAGWYKTKEQNGCLPGHYDPSEYLTCRACAYAISRDGAKGLEYFCVHKKLRDKTSRNSFKTIIGKRINKPIKVVDGFYMENNVMAFFPACPLREIQASCIRVSDTFLDEGEKP